MPLVIDMPLIKVLVFKTSVQSTDDVDALRPYLIQLVTNGKWNFDLEDCDKILRIETRADITNRVIALLNKLGYDCAELED